MCKGNDIYIVIKLNYLLSEDQYVLFDGFVWRFSLHERRLMR